MVINSQQLARDLWKMEEKTRHDKKHQNSKRKAKFYLRVKQGDLMHLKEMQNSGKIENGWKIFAERWR